MAYINFTSYVNHINTTRNGLAQTISFNPSEFTILQSDSVTGNRKEHWSIDQRTVEVCQWPKAYRSRIVVPCIPEGDTIDGTNMGKQYWDEWVDSVCLGQEFEIDASDIPSIVDYWHDTSNVLINTDDQKSFYCILEGGIVNWSRQRSRRNGQCVFNHTIDFNVRLVRSEDQFDQDLPQPV